MPAAFIGHGSPMNALESNRYTESWRALGAALPRPRAVLVVSAHWYINATAVTAMPRPRTIHDFFGFPGALFDVDYPAPGAPDVAAEVEEIAKPTWVGQDVDSWGIDHGTWSVLTHMFPGADVPVIQLSIDAGKSFDEHLDLGARLAPLRDSGVLVVGSGNVVHNLGGMDPRRRDEGFDWAQRFDEAARATMTGSPDALPGIVGSADFPAAVPTPDHFIPLLYLAGLGAASGNRADVLVDGYAYGSLSMTAYTLDLDRPVAADGPPGAGSVPAGRPPEDMNI
ncbi:4,5-DOPA dioxygenase extradiol [Pseudonocardia petroleophila]|uniref:4,5-DOPA dioxygenase extradiol n=2 Tax=Pseudonocardia petroleophila TaxID=37331 RepID=A0A7G7MR66_9PSEU|nr:4,5-DOPA dioxygenase extradiol [Pseudonocardia petroleophila]